jgi:hypothetical protein
MGIKRVVRKLFIYFKKAYDSLRREVLGNDRIEFGYNHETGKANKNVSDRNILHSPGRQELVRHVPCKAVFLNLCQTAAR